MDSETLLLKTSFDSSMLKDPATLGKSLLRGSLTMSVVHGEEQLLLSCLTEIENSLRSILNENNFSPVVATYITQDDHIKPTTTVTFFAQRKTPGKSGAH